MLSKIISSFLPLLPKKLIWIFSKKYIAGDSLEQAVRVSKELNSKNFLVTLDLLGEFIKNLDEARINKESYLEIIEKIEANNIKGNYSLKPTMFGLLLDKEVCYQNIREIVKKAAEYSNFVRIDMEDSRCTDDEIEIFTKLKNEFPKNVGLVVQAYLKRTYNDINKMQGLNSKEIPLNFRLCKGIYVEPEEISYKEYDKINEHYIKDLDYLLKNKNYPAIATHDKYLVDKVYKLLNKYQPEKDKYEFQMLYGVTPELRQKILNDGHRLRVYVPFGKDWYAYSVRRLKENPKIVNHIIKALFIRG